MNGKPDSAVACGSGGTPKQFNNKYGVFCELYNLYGKWYKALLGNYPDFCVRNNLLEFVFMCQTKTYSLLLADDDSDEIEFLVESFEKNDQFNVEFVAKNGVELVDYITKNPNSIDIIISDMFMPAMTGVEAVEKLMRADLISDTLTVIFSNTVNVENQEKFPPTNLLKFYTKPASISEYENLPQKLLNLMQNKAAN